VQTLLRDVATCPICGGSSQSTIYRSNIDFEKIARGDVRPYGAHYSINQCNGCGLMLSNPVFVEEQVKRLYEQAETTNVNADEEDNVRRTMRNYYRLVQPFLTCKDKMLDIGCDLGFLLEAASKDGFVELHGIEPNPLARRRAEKIPGAEITEKFYEEQYYPEESFDLISLIHVLDHVYNPQEVLGRAYSQLKPGGILIAVVHNVECLLGRLLGERFPVFNLYHHYFFSKKTLRALAESVGYQVKDVVDTKNCFSLKFFTKKFPFLPGFIKNPLAAFLSLIGLGSLPITVRVGNIGVIAQRPV
jgi:2-polyprenyl-3-methyl-5-hydroxy-6-metoxy-1,4-benzoquinol methylase